MILDWKTLPRPIAALSPMADMTDSAFCRAVRAVTSHGSGGSAVGPQTARNASEHWRGETALTGPDRVIVFREMVSSEAVVRGNDKTLGMTEIHPDERPLVQQIFGSDPHTMSEAARIIEAEDHPEGFDINMGCPVYKIVHNFNGAALMKEPKLASDIVKKMKAAISVPLSVKIRLGWSEKTDCVEFAKVLEDAGANLLTVHGRTKCQGYAGAADWEMIGRVKAAVSIPVLCNGDIHQAEKVLPALEQSHCDGVLIARGALGNPWIFSQIEEVLSGKPRTIIRLEERVRMVRLHLALHCEQYGPRGVVTFRKHLSWYFKGLPGAKKFRDRLHTTSTMEDLHLILNEMLTCHSEEPKATKNLSEDPSLALRMTEKISCASAS
ncbi:MAG: tRNA-dihydrouridine synthase [Candidatus Uhrbacteria bacterium GW2011_GWA2_53_10]|uniref:tRNA-dihydrouridine synthase n=1 Tax=Candidatus Uhrbacteria bacterium GW2011_GWA2_53_10 TaxID=1618980 RepID=A0A0G1XPS0_9BACT|nr:MAG: tRNA-dihydrouridine synthase [Candidatus Uhrbacteria bacterium GW2011_GWA2_53_10]